MTHDSALRTVVGLVPEIEKSGAAKVFADYAAKNDLPPTQLEKLAQVYNTLATVSHIDNADEAARGDSVALLDVPQLVMDYVSRPEHVKAAAPRIAMASHDIRIVDLNRAVKFELRPRIEKAASEVTAPPEDAQAAFARRVTRDDIKASLLELEVDLEDEMSKLASAIFTAAAPIQDARGRVSARDIAEFEEEALRYQPEFAVKAAGAFMEKFAAPHRAQIARFDYSRMPAATAYDIPHEMGEKFAELAKTAMTYDLIKRASDDDEEALAVLRAALPQSPDEAFLPNYNAGNKDPRAPELQEGEGDPAELLNRMQEEGLLGKTEQTPAGPRADTSSENRKPSGESDKGKDSKHGAGSLALDLAAAPFAAVGNAVTGAAKKTDEWLSNVVSKERSNRAQKATDMSVEDIKRAMNVRRLIGTDPVLKDADPRAVLEIYNTIAARNPDIAGDMASLRLVLREAVSYEGLTLDSQKLLTEIRRNSEQGAKESDENSRRRYAVGGANPLAIASKALQT